MMKIVRLGFEDEPSSEVLASLEHVIDHDISNVEVLSIGHQKYLDLDTKFNKSTGEPPVWKLLTQIEPHSLRRIDINFHYTIKSDKEERRYEKSKQRLQALLSKLAESLQRKIINDAKQVSIDGNSQRVDEPNMAVVSGCASILFTETSL